MPHPHSRNRLSPDDLARLLASQLASAEPQKATFSFRNSVLVGRLIAGLFILGTSAAFLGAVLLGVDWWTDRSTAAEVLDAQIEVESDSPTTVSTSRAVAIAQLPSPVTTELLVASDASSTTGPHDPSSTPSASTTAPSTTLIPTTTSSTSVTTTTDSETSTTPESTTTTTTTQTTTTTSAATVTTCAGNPGGGKGRGPCGP